MAKGRRNVVYVLVTAPLAELARARATLTRIMASPARVELLAVVYRLRLMLQALNRHVDGESAYSSELNVLAKLHGKEDTSSMQPGAYEFTPDGLKAYTKARAELDDQMETLSVPLVYLSEIMEIRLAPPLTNEEYLTLEWLMDDAPPAQPAAAASPRGDDLPARVVDDPPARVVELNV